MIEPNQEILLMKKLRFNPHGVERWNGMEIMFMYDWYKYKYIL